MREISYWPKNRAHFSKLLSFAKELFEICKKLNIKPVVYGSVSYAFYTKDKTININDIDLLFQNHLFL